MAAKRHSSHPSHPQHGVPQEDARRTIQHLLSGLAGRLPAQQSSFQSAFLLNFHQASQPTYSHLSKGASRHGRS